VLWRALELDRKRLKCCNCNGCREPNEEAIRLVEDMILENCQRGQLIRMYRNGQPEQLSCRVFAVTSAEICGFWRFCGVLCGGSVGVEPSKHWSDCYYFDVSVNRKYVIITFQLPTNFSRRPCHKSNNHVGQKNCWSSEARSVALLGPINQMQLKGARPTAIKEWWSCLGYIMDMLNCCQPTDINSQQWLSILRELRVIIECHG